MPHKAFKWEKEEKPMEKKKVVKRPKFEIKVSKMWWDWYRTEGQYAVSKFIRKHFDKYFDVKGK